MEKSIAEKTCQNCRYYLQYYVKLELKYTATLCGHCVDKHSKKYRAVFCEYWEEIVIQRQERNKSIKAVLEEMAKDISEIALVLENEED